MLLPQASKVLINHNVGLKNRFSYVELFLTTVLIPNPLYATN